MDNIEIEMIINLPFLYLPFHNISKGIGHNNYAYKKAEYLPFLLYISFWLWLVRTFQGIGILELLAGKCNTRKTINRNVINMTKLRSLEYSEYKGLPSWKL